MSLEDAQRLIAQAQQNLSDAAAALRVVDPIATPDALDAALAIAVPGQTILLSTQLVYPAPFTLRVPVTLQSETWADHIGEPIAVDAPAPRFVGGFSAPADGHQVLGVELRHPDPTKTIAVMGGRRVTWDRVRVLGDALLGGKRGIEFRGRDGVILNSWVDDIFQPAQDTQAIYSQEMIAGGGLKILGCYLRAAGEVVMFGGGDSSAPETMPSNIVLDDCVLDKRPEWLEVVGPGKHRQQVKNGLELKAVDGFASARCTIRRPGGVSDGQGAYALLLGPRNQNGLAPWSRVSHVTIEDLTIEGLGTTSGLVSLRGSDNDHPSGVLADVTLRRVIASGLDPAFYGVDAKGTRQATGRLFSFDRAPQRVTLDTITARGANLRALGYFQGLQPPTGLTIAGMDLPIGTAYGWKLDANTHAAGQTWPANARAALLAYMPDAQLDSTVM